MSDADSKKTYERRILYAFLIGTLVVGSTASVFTEPNIAGWYAALAKPSFNPPNFVFAPVWTALYVMMAVAAWRAWRVAGVMSVALMLYFLQLTFNFAWSLIFFAQHLIEIALIDIAVLWIAILATMIAFFRADRIAGWLMLPYLVWVSFAAALNWEILRLN
ncbi:MAG TPA: TspO/MBR family protein [Rhizomicrobium sp.]|nr:TspO/MBR family protein [Rhizomicrobium sp.]